MRDPDRIPFMLERIETLWRAVPDWRLSQVIVNALDVTSPETFYAEDERLIVGIERLIGTYAPSSHEGGERGDD